MVRLPHGITLPAAAALRRYPARATWLEARRDGIGGSDAPKICGWSPYGSTWDVWRSKVEPSEEKGPTPIRFVRGLREEKRILEDWAAETGGRYIGPLGWLSVIGPHPLAVTLDAFVQVDGVWGAGECKMSDEHQRFRWGRSGTTIHRWSAAAESIVREDHAGQCYAMMAATGLPFAILMVKISINDQRWFRIEADPVAQRVILNDCAAWWARHIDGGELPEPDSSDACAAAYAKLFPIPTDKPRRQATAEETQLAHERYRVAKQIDELKDRKRELSAELAKRIGDDDGYALDFRVNGQDYRCRYQNEGGRSYFDAASLKADHPDLARQYTRDRPQGRGIRVEPVGRKK